MNIVVLQTVMKKKNFFWSNLDDDSIIAWCSLSDIEPYKNE